MKTIRLTQSKVALVDDEDFERVNQYQWHVAKNKGTLWYAAARPDGHKREYMHRFILNLGPGEMTDHKNGDGLDNRKENLRRCSNSENAHNSKLHGDNHSGFRGVSLHRPTNKWQTHIRINGQKVNLGYYANKIDAAKAYDQAAQKYFGEFARLNMT